MSKSERNSPRRLSISIPCAVRRNTLARDLLDAICGIRLAHRERGHRFLQRIDVDEGRLDVTYNGDTIQLGIELPRDPLQRRHDTGGADCALRIAKHEPKPLIVETRDPLLGFGIVARHHNVVEHVRRASHADIPLQQRKPPISCFQRSVMKSKFCRHGITAMTGRDVSEPLPDSILLDLTPRIDDPLRIGRQICAVLAIVE